MDDQSEPFATEAARVSSPLSFLGSNIADPKRPFEALGNPDGLQEKSAEASPGLKAETFRRTPT